MPQQIERQAARTPDAIAVTCEGTSLSYRELNRRANQLAHRLRPLGVGPESSSRSDLERSLDMVVGLLGILKAGGAYLPIDAAYPRERVRVHVRGRPAGGGADLVGTTRVPAHMRRAGLVAGRRPGGIRSGSPTHDPEPLARPDNLAYVIYTSGSTGQPKGAR